MATPPSAPGIPIASLPDVVQPLAKDLDSGHKLQRRPLLRGARAGAPL